MGLTLDFAYLLVCIVLSPWLVYRLATTGYGDLKRRFGLNLGAPLKRSIWLHGSSAGEVALLRPLVDGNAQDRVRDLILEAYEAHEEQAAMAE